MRPYLGLGAGTLAGAESLAEESREDRAGRAGIERGLKRLFGLA